MYIGTNYYNNIYSGFLKTQGVTSLYGTSAAKSAYQAMLSLSKNGGNKDLMQTGTMKYVTALKSGSSAISLALGSLGSSAFRQKAAISSDSESLSVAQSGGRIYSLSEESKIKISRLATAQVNEGDSLNSSSITGAAGRHKFAVESDGKVYNLEIQLRPGDTYGDLQSRMASVVNESGAGIKAAVESDGSGKSRLILTGNKTGGAAGFEIRDVGGGRAVALTGAGSVKTGAGDAVYTLNGVEKNSSENTVDLGNGVSATLKKASDAEITVSRGIDREQVIKAMGTFAESYNSMYTAALSNSGSDAKAERLAGQMIDMATRYASSLNRVGIGFDADGKMVIDGEKAAKAASDGSLERFFTENRGSSMGYVNQIGMLADKVNRNTLSYVSTSAVRSDLDSALFSGLYSGNGRLATAGLIFDLML